MHHERQSPDLGEEVRASGIEALAQRLERYAKAKNRALDVSKYMCSLDGMGTLAGRVESCGEYMLFRHYFTVDELRLHAASFCCKHLLCPLCAIRRGSKALQAYLPRYELVRAANPALRPFLVTLTVKDGPDLAERFKLLQTSQSVLWRRRHRGNAPSAFSDIAAAVWSYEVKRGEGSGQWHPHLHMVAMAENAPDQVALSEQWHQITGDSFVVDVRPITDPVDGFLEVFKYALKFSDMTEADTVEAFQVLKGRRLVASAGAFRGVEIPEELTDAPLDDLPFVELLFMHLGGAYVRSARRATTLPSPQ